MLPFLQSNVTLVAGAIVALAIIGLRAATQEKTLRRDLRGALTYFFLFFALRVADLVAGDLLSPGGHKAITVAWMLMFAFGAIRFFVSVGLWVLRLRSSVPTPKILRDVVDFSLYALAAIPILKTQLSIDLTSLVATSAILSVVLGLALQDTLGNLFAGLAIQVERPFQVGDYVTIGQHSGRVVQVAWRATRLETFRNEVITIPNNVLSKEAVKNFSRGHQPVGTDLFVVVGFEAPPNAVKETMLAAVREVALVLPEPGPKCRVWGYEDRGIRYQIRYWVDDYLQADNAMEEIYTRLWYRLRREGIRLALPQRMVHTAPDEASQREVDDATVERLLESVDLFSILGAADRQTLARELEPRRFGRGERIIEQGTTGHTFYLVVSGEVSVRTGKPEAEIARLRRGQYFGEMSLLTGEPRVASVVALTDSLLLELDRPFFARLFSEHANLARQLSAILAQRRTQLRQVVETPHGPVDHVPEANRILHRLKSIFGLSD